MVDLVDSLVVKNSAVCSMVYGFDSMMISVVIDLDPDDDPVDLVNHVDLYQVDHEHLNRIEHVVNMIVSVVLSQWSMCLNCQISVQVF